ncbi:hypothetical protein LCGC14_2680590 [marine sediment metagenome]|uniref:Uncharacterized protein n=1 Tax=marine sediment metagenome TaxID=412755 RepID=A0A0F8ZLG9_9ZZZZ
MANAPNITIDRQTIGWTDSYYYPETELASGVVSDVPLLSWNAASTSDTFTIESDVPETTFHLNNINSPKTRYIIGSDQAIDMAIEFLKVIPN